MPALRAQPARHHGFWSRHLWLESQCVSWRSLVWTRHLVRPPTAPPCDLCVDGTVLLKQAVPRGTVGEGDHRGWHAAPEPEGCPGRALPPPFPPPARFEVGLVYGGVGVRVCCWDRAPRCPQLHPCHSSQPSFLRSHWPGVVAVVGGGAERTRVGGVDRELSTRRGPWAAGGSQEEGQLSRAWPRGTGGPQRGRRGGPEDGAGDGGGACRAPGQARAGPRGASVSGPGHGCAAWSCGTRGGKLQAGCLWWAWGLGARLLRRTLRVGWCLPG